MDKEAKLKERDDLVEDDDEGEDEEQEEEIS